MTKRQSYASLDPIRFGLALGIVWSSGMFLMAVMASFGWGVPAVEIAGSVYIGFAPGIVGAIIGAAWGLVDGFVFGAVVAWLYGWLLRRK